VKSEKPVSLKKTLRKEAVNNDIDGEGEMN